MSAAISAVGMANCAPFGNSVTGIDCGYPAKTNIEPSGDQEMGDWGGPARDERPRITMPAAAPPTRLSGSEVASGLGSTTTEEIENWYGVTETDPGSVTDQASLWLSGDQSNELICRSQQ